MSSSVPAGSSSRGSAPSLVTGPPSAAFAAMLGSASRPCLACLPVVVAVLWVVRGRSGGLSALLGAAVTLAFLSAGLFAMQRLVRRDPLSMLAAALAVYLGQLLVLGLLLLVLAPASWLDGMAFALAALVLALVWQVFQVVAFVRMRKPVYDEGSVVSPVPANGGTSTEGSVPGGAVPGGAAPGGAAPGSATSGGG